MQEIRIHSNPPVITGICDPIKSQARHQHNKVSLKKLHLTNLTSLKIKKYTPATQLKTLHTLQIFQKTSLWLVSDKSLALHHFYAPKNHIVTET